MNKFIFLEPTSEKEAFSMYTSIKKKQKRSIYLAGGTDLLVRIKKEEISPDYLISLNNIKKYKNIWIEPDSGDLSIGSLVTHRELEKSKLIRKKYKILHDAISCIGSVQIRNIATIGGNIVNAIPSADSVIPLIALDSSIYLQKNNKERSLKLSKFFLEPRKTLLKPGEILTKIIIPKNNYPTSGAYKKFGRRSAMELPIISVGIALSIEEKTHICKKARICLGVAGPIPTRIKKAEKILEDQNITIKLLNEAGIIAANESKARNSNRGKLWYRKELISVYVERMGNLTIQRIKNLSK